MKAVLGPQEHTHKGDALTWQVVINGKGAAARHNQARIVPRGAHRATKLIRLRIIHKDVVVVPAKYTRESVKSVVYNIAI